MPEIRIEVSIDITAKRVRPQDVELGWMLGMVVINGVPHHLELVRVVDIQNLDGCFVQEPYNSQVDTSRFPELRQSPPGRYETIKLPGQPGDWVACVFPYATK